MNKKLVEQYEVYMQDIDAALENFIFTENEAGKVYQIKFLYCTDTAAKAISNNECDHKPSQLVFQCYGVLQLTGSPLVMNIYFEKTFLEKITKVPQNHIEMIALDNGDYLCKEKEVGEIVLEEV